MSIKILLKSVTIENEKQHNFGTGLDNAECGNIIY